METKVQITASFHRFVETAPGKPERKEVFSKGQVVTASAEDAASWIDAKGLAKAVPSPVTPPAPSAPTA